MYSVRVPPTNRQLLSDEEVRHVAALARLKLNDEQIAQYRVQLTAVLQHIETLKRLDVTGVTPMAHPTDHFNRMDADEEGRSIPIGDLLQNAPKPDGVEDRFLAVPKVLADGGS